MRIAKNQAGMRSVPLGRSVGREESLVNQAIELLKERAQACGGDALLEEVAEEISRMRILAGEAYEAWEHDRDTRVGKLLRAMGDDKFCQTYRPDLWPPNVKVTGAPPHGGQQENER